MALDRKTETTITVNIDSIVDKFGRQFDGILNAAILETTERISWLQWGRLKWVEYSGIECNRVKCSGVKCSGVECSGVEAYVQYIPIPFNALNF